jgi:peptidyl-prolyl cis-trans isomerase SurA
MRLAMNALCNNELHMCSKLWFAGAFVLTGVLSVGSVLAADRAPDVPPVVVEEIVAKVNGAIITRGELEQQRTMLKAKLEQQGVIGAQLDQELNKVAADGLREKIDSLLLVQKGKELNINVDADVNRRIADIQSESKIADPEKFHEWVHQQTGQTFEDLKQEYHDAILTQRVIGEEVYRNVVIPKAELQDYYNKHKAEFVRQEVVHLRDILVSTGDNSPAKVAAAEKKAKDLVSRARSGEKFTDLARQNSDGPTAAQDGELGSFKPGELAPAIDQVVFKQNKGYVTDPIRTPGGFEIIRVEDHFQAGQESFDEAQQDIHGKLAEERVAPKVREYLTQLRQNAFLEIKPGYVDSGAAPNKDTTWRDALQLKPETTTKAAVQNQRHMKKFMHVVPYGRTGVKDASATTPTVAPVPNTPVPNADGSSPK